MRDRKTKKIQTALNLVVHSDREMSEYPIDLELKWWKISPLE
jgi:hypothetical protein